MCGILAILDDNIPEEHLSTKLKEIIDRRGPDFKSPLVYRETRCGFKLKLAASILHLTENHELDTSKSDTLYLLEKLTLAKCRLEVASIFAKIDGPFAFIYWNDNLCCLFYGRDIFGRKSLCYLQTKNEIYPSVISSVAPCIFDRNTNYSWSEVDSRGVHCLDFSASRTQPHLKKFLYNIDLIYPASPKCQIETKLSVLEADIQVHNNLKPLNEDPRGPEVFSPSDVEQACHCLTQKILDSVAKRIKYNRQECLRCRNNTSGNTALKHCNHSKVAVAFSGGLDSTVLALAIDKILDKNETIDLLTVAFKEDSPDRGSVRCAYEEIRKLCPWRCWRLVLTDVTKAQLQEARANRIRDLISPCKTVIDDSLGCACWFISRGEGRALDSTLDDDAFNMILPKFVPYNPQFVDTNSNYTVSSHILIDYCSPASIIFAGSAIDEQLGGYSSHREAWSKKGALGCYEEILFQMRRLPSRNLGRDDRVYSDHGRDLKIPYLDFALVSYLNELPVGIKMNLDEPMDAGPKRILRLSANTWGLIKTSRQVKRALQFGTRIAKLESCQERGDDICNRLE